MAWDNRKRIQLARGTSAGLVANIGMNQAGGQPVFISDKRYLTIGVNNNNGGENTVTKQVPIRARTLMGWYADQEQVTGGEADTFTMTARPTNDKYSDKYILTADSNKTYFSSGKSLKFYRADATKFDGSEVLTLDYSTNNDIVNVNSGDLRSSKLTVTDIYAGGASTASLSGNPLLKITNNSLKINGNLFVTGNILTVTNEYNEYTIPSLAGSASAGKKSDTFVLAAASQDLTGKTYNGYTLGTACELSAASAMTSASYISSDTSTAITKNALAYWNGAYDSNGSSRLAYCNRGAFGTIVTKSSTDYLNISTKSDTNGTDAILNRSLHFDQTGATESKWLGISGQIANNDYWIIRGSQTKENLGYLEIATGDDGTGTGGEPIYVCQYGKAGNFGDIYKYNLKDASRVATLLDASGNTIFPQNVSSQSLTTGAINCSSINISTT